MSDYNWKEARAQAGLTLLGACKAVGCGESTLWRIETGRTKRLDHGLVERLKSLYADLAAKREAAAQQAAS